MIAVAIPTTRPCESTSGPPEFPGLIGTSVWIRSVSSTPGETGSFRPKALTTPAVTVQLSPNGFPTATTSCPTRSTALFSSATGSV